MFGSQKPRGATAVRQPKSILTGRRLIIGAGLGIIAAGLWLAPDNPEAPDTAGTTLEAAAPDARELIEIIPQGQRYVPPAPDWEERTVRNGDTLAAIFQRAGFSSRDVHAVVNQAPDGKALGRIHPGQTIAFLADDAGDLLAVRHIKDALETVEYRRFDSGFSSETLLREPQMRENHASGEIKSSLFLAGQSAGMSQNLIMEMANIFGGVIDFVLDPRKGDTMRVLYTEQWL